MLASTSTAPSSWHGIVIGLVAVGWNVYKAVVERKRRVLVRQVGTSITDRVEARNDEPTIYQLDVSITNDSPGRPVVIAGYRLLPPWNDEYISLLPDPP
jgi:hypothetical protein